MGQGRPVTGEQWDRGALGRGDSGAGASWDGEQWGRGAMGRGNKRDMGAL